MSKTNEWQRARDEELMAWLMNSFLVKTEGLTVENAADCYDDMNGNTEFTDCLRRLGMIG